MKIAAFERDPEASATATILREQGYDSKIVKQGQDDYDERVGEFFKGKPQTYEPRAFVISEEAEFEPFMKAAQRHYGFIIRDDIE